MEQYTYRFQDLAPFALKIVDDDAELKAMYMKGLHCGIYKMMLALDVCMMT